MAEGVRPDTRVVAAYLDEVEVEIDAVRRLVDPPNRLAAYHLEQAAEKLVKAVRLHRGIPATREHILERLIEDLPADDIWRGRMVPFEWTSAFATSYRYPTTSGRRPPGPEAAELLQAAEELTLLLKTAREELLSTPPGS